MNRILFLADPSSIHDQKWILFFEEVYQVHLIRRDRHVFNSNFANATDHGTIADFSLRHPIRTLRSLMRIRRIVRLYKIQLIHIFYAEPNLLWAIFRKIFDIPIIVTCRGSDVLVAIQSHFVKGSLPNLLYVRSLYRRAFGSCDHIACTSLGQIATLKDLFAIEGKTSLIRTGIDEPNGVLSPEHLPQNLRETPYVLMPRVMKPLYYHELTIAAINLLPPDTKSQYKYVFIDRDSANEDYVHQIEGKMSETSGAIFEFLPRQTQGDLQVLFKHASLVVMHPKSDGTPVSAIEAMYYEIPLILGPLEYDNDLFGDWVAKLESWDAKELAGKMTALLQNDDPQKRAQGRLAVLDRGLRRTEMAKLGQIYANLMASRTERKDA